MKEKKSAGAVVYAKIQETIKFLLIKSRYWGFPKGWIESGESEQDAAIREVKEETNLEVSFLPGFSHVQEWFYKIDGQLIKKRAVFFLTKIEKEEAEKVKISEEHTEFVWATYEESLKLMRIKANRDMLTEAYNFIKEFEAQRRLS